MGGVFFGGFFFWVFFFFVFFSRGVFLVTSYINSQNPPS